VTGKDWGARLGCSRVRGRAFTRTLADVDTPVTAIRLEVRLVGDLPVGRAYGDQGSTRDFAGWMALVATIDGLLTITQPGFDTPSPDERSGP
jgi:hypothetical protein